MPKKTASKTPEAVPAAKKTAARKASLKKATPSRATVKKPARQPATKKGARGKSARAQAPSFEREINSFVLDIESLSKALDPTMSAMVESLNKSSDAMSSFIEKKRVRRAKEDGSEVFRIKPADLPQFERRMKAMTSASLAVKNIPELFLCSLVHKYDAYLGRLLRVAFAVRPGILSASQKNLTYSDLAKFSSLSDARESLIAKALQGFVWAGMG